MTDAPFGRRLAARILDLLFALALTFVMVIPVGIVFVPLSLAVDEGSAAYDALIATAASLAYFLAYVALEWFLLVRRDGQTLGKGLMGLRVVPTGTGPLTLRSAFVRLAILLVPFVMFSVAGSDDGADTVWDFLAYLGLFTIMASLVLAALRRNHRRTVHDLAASSRVVTASKRGINLRADLPMMVPRKVSFEKRV